MDSSSRTRWTFRPIGPWRSQPQHSALTSKDVYRCPWLAFSHFILPVANSLMKLHTVFCRFVSKNTETMLQTQMLSVSGGRWSKRKRALIGVEATHAAAKFGGGVSFFFLALLNEKEIGHWPSEPTWCRKNNSYYVWHSRFTAAFTMPTPFSDHIPPRIQRICIVLRPNNINMIQNLHNCPIRAVRGFSSALVFSVLADTGTANALGSERSLAKNDLNCVLWSCKQKFWPFLSFICTEVCLWAPCISTKIIRSQTSSNQWCWEMLRGSASAGIGSREKQWETLCETQAKNSTLLFASAGWFWSTAVIYTTGISQQTSFFSFGNQVSARLRHANEKQGVQLKLSRRICFKRKGQMSFRTSISKSLISGIAWDQCEQRIWSAMSFCHQSRGSESIRKKLPSTNTSFPVFTQFFVSPTTFQRLCVTQLSCCRPKEPCVFNFLMGRGRHPHTDQDQVVWTQNTETCSFGEKDQQVLLWCKQHFVNLVSPSTSFASGCEIYLFCFCQKIPLYSTERPRLRKFTDPSRRQKKHLPCFLCKYHQEILWFKSELLFQVSTGVSAETKILRCEFLPQFQTNTARISCKKCGMIVSFCVFFYPFHKIACRYSGLNVKQEVGHLVKISAPNSFGKSRISCCQRCVWEVQRN